MGREPRAGVAGQLIWTDPPCGQVSQNREAVDLDVALAWICDQWRATVYDRTEERLAALFAAADADGNGELDLGEFREAVRRVGQDKTRAVSPRQLLRMYGRMALAPRVDAALFIRHARAHGVGEFVLGAGEDPGAVPDGRQMLERVGADLGKIEGVIAGVVRSQADAAVGVRAAQNLQVRGPRRSLWWLRAPCACFACLPRSGV